MALGDWAAHHPECGFAADCHACTHITLSRFYRKAGATLYGYGLFSKELTYDDYVAMFHAANERCDVHSLALMERLWTDIAVDLLA